MSKDFDLEFNVGLMELIHGHPNHELVIQFLGDHLIAILVATIRTKAKDKDGLIGSCFANIGLVTEKFYEKVRLLAHLNYPEEGEKLH